MKKGLVSMLLLFVLLVTNAQNKEPFPFWNEVQKFKAADSAAFPASNQILLIGSSSFTLWKDVQDYFPDRKILNRAFGGSTLADVIRYRYDVVFPYQPKQIVIYCGENDFASSDTVTVELVVQRFTTLFNFIRAKYKTVPVAYVSMKPSPSRLHLLEKYKEGNKRIQAFLSTKPNTKFVDVYSAMLTASGEPMPDIFKEDSLHMNAKGYAIWKTKLEKVLLK
ncbi:G-D-S-L family lipolytic protein [Lacibacter luteus]|uniref:G-D-S-L family lipolytic protein n=1 Tax=Lacibacter luteus TaxID=2508719 RepID=A0A4Q1CMG9_9BACT|nr:GDSL-type esterase/lipase family protein [Lacibacter luteus]RXK62258.1 G-D-S-L family lipolytic protein [Lacibacter luteus]